MVWFKRNRRRAVDPGFRKASGLAYLDFLAAVHASRKPQWYLEIGTERGLSLAKAKGNAIAIDPDFRIKAKLSVPGQLHLFPMTSDAFFATDFLKRNKITLDFAFLDGLHHFEFLLRDFINAERHSAKDGLIALHDCVPYNRVMADRNWDTRQTVSWTGDVWKLLPILRKYRPDLVIEVLDCSHTGLVLISNLNPGSRVLKSKHDKIVSDWMDVSLDDYGLEKLASDFPLVSAERFAEKMK